MSIWHYLSGPVIGAVIGYFTNYIAVKMLFRPLKEVKIGCFTLPFTPGMIPKRKDALASAVGKAVGASLLTEEDLTEMLLSKDVENSIVDICMLQMNAYLDSQDTIKNAVAPLTGNSAYQKGRMLLKESIIRKVMDGIRDMRPADIIAEEGKKVVSGKLEGSMFAMLLNDKFLDSIAGEIGAYAEAYLLENGPYYVEQQVEKELTGFEEHHLCEVREWIPAEDEAIREKLHLVYRKCVGKFADSIVKKFHVAEIVEQKIRSMDVLELEELVMSVMKHELGMIVNLGAFIGCILGILNMLF